MVMPFYKSLQDEDDSRAANDHRASAGRTSYPVARAPDQLRPINKPSLSRPGSHLERQSFSGIDTTWKPL